VDRASLPTVDQAKAQQEERGETLEKAPAAGLETKPRDPAQEQVAALERALSERHAEEGRQLGLRQGAEYQRTADVLDGEIAEKLKALEAVHQGERDRYEREHLVQPQGFAGMVAAVRAAINPERAAEEVRMQLEADAAFLRGQEIERQEQSRALNAGKQRDLAELTERHAQQQREHAARFEEERARYLREHEAAAKLLAEIEERRRQQEEERNLSRDGPPPPGRAR
jgi:hypothetical protein